MAKEKRKYSVNVFQSLRTRLILMMILMMILALLIFWVLNYTLLSPFYERSKATSLAASYQRVNGVILSDEDYVKGEKGLSADSQLKLEIIRENSSAGLYIFRVTNFVNKIYYEFDYPSVDDIQQRWLEELTKSYIFDLTGNVADGDSDREIVRKRKEYSICKVYDSRIGSYYLELFGQLDSGVFIYMRTNYQSMEESVATFSTFIGYATIGVMLSGIIMMVFFGNSFAKPILQITDIAKRMSELDFNVKYPVTTQDEIGVLGNSINELSETLEATISELKAANNELQKDIEQKIQIDEMRKEFLSNVSHELKTPIALVQGYAEGLQENINDDRESREFYCEVIVDEAKKMNRMVQKLLTLNQIEFGNNQVTFERFDIVSLIQNIMQSARILAEQKGAGIVLAEEYGPVYVWADEYFVEEVVTNYISNAINHVEGENRIVISLEDRTELLRVRVFNTGKPIPEEDIDKVWIKFYKVDKARTRAYGGSGIGLSIVKAVMDSMHQECGVRNVKDGVEFWFELDKKN